MTDQQTEAPAAAEPSDDSRIGKLEEKVDRILGMLEGGGSKGEEPVAADPKAEMRQELAKLQAAEKRKQAAADMREKNESRLKALEDKITEKPPAEHRKGVTGWWQRANQWERDDQRKM